MSGSISERIASYQRLKNEFVQQKLRLYKGSRIDFADSRAVQDVVDLINAWLENEDDNHQSLYAFEDDFLTAYYQGYLSTRLNDNPDSLTSIPFSSTPVGKFLCSNASIICFNPPR
jgi:outer membrane phospholipase A